MFNSSYSAKVSEVFNDFFINVAKNIGNTNVIVNKEHPSVCMIKENKLITYDLNFKPVSSNFVSKQINKLNIKKATGYDGISPKILKLSMPCIVEPITFFINKCIDVSIFPDKLKTAQVRPLFKKNNILEKGNYRPVSVLPTISKFVDRAIFDQLTDFFNFHFYPSLSAFRKGFGCQTALLKIIEDWKKALDENKYIAAILMDLSKAFFF